MMSTLTPEAERVDASEGMSCCSSCQTALPLRSPKSSELPVRWECARCGAQLTGVLDEQATGDVHFNVYPAPVNFACDQFEHSHQRIENFAQLMLPRNEPTEKRTSPREQLCLAAAAMPMDEQRQAKGVAFMVLVQNISSGGIAFCHAQPIKEPYVALELWAADGSRMKVMVRVLRTRAVGHFYEIAGEFVTQ